MTPEQQQIAIAEACGWYDLVKQDVSLFGKHEPESQKTFELDVPDYLNDLNAMHEAEFYQRRQSELWWKSYSAALYHAYGVGAPAKYRAEIFLRTLNLWTP